MPTVKKNPPPAPIPEPRREHSSERLAHQDVAGKSEWFDVWVREEHRLTSGCILGHAEMTYRAVEGGPGRVLLLLASECSGGPVWTAVPEYWVVRGEAPRPIPPRRGERLSSAIPVNVRVEPNGKLQARMERPKAKDNKLAVKAARQEAAKPVVSSAAPSSKQAQKLF